MQHIIYTQPKQGMDNGFDEIPGFVALHSNEDNISRDLLGMIVANKPGSTVNRRFLKFDRVFQNQITKSYPSHNGKPFSYQNFFFRAAAT